MDKTLALQMQEPRTVEALRALADANRMHIATMLSQKEMCAIELLQQLEISQPTLSHHMKTLVEAGLLTERKKGRRTYYAIQRRTWDEFMLVLDTISNETYWAHVDLTPGA